MEFSKCLFLRRGKTVVFCVLFLFFVCVCVCVFFLALRIETGVNTRTGVNTELKNPGNLIMPLPERPISGYSYVSKPEQHND